MFYSIIYEMLPSGCYVIDAKYIVKGSFGMEICIAPNAHFVYVRCNCHVIILPIFIIIMHVQIS